MTTPQSTTTELSWPPEPDDGVHYPNAHDALPVESMFQFVPQSYMQGALENWLADPTTLVAGQMFIYYESGDIRSSVAPDVYVIPNVGNALRRSYFLWLEREYPVFAMEIASENTYQNDAGFKYRLYESWGVTEYWRYDPEGKHMTPLLQGYRLVNGRYESIPVAVDAESGECRGFSPLLNLELYGRRGWFRFRNPATGEFLNNLQEAEQGRLSAEQGRTAAEAALAVAEARIRQLEERLNNPPHP